VLKQLPPNTNKLISRYENLRIGKYKIRCPYYQNINQRKGRAVFIGKGLPVEIECETKNIFNKTGKDINNFDPLNIRFYMVMAGLGIDCSGFVVRILQSLLKEEKLGNLSNNIKPKNDIFHFARHFVRPFTNLSADTLTNEENSIKIQDLNKIRPGDLIREGKSHLAIISSVEFKGKKVKTITYHHSTSDYLDQHGVRKGKIHIINEDKALSEQNWTEEYRGENWMLKDYLKANKIDRGIRRLKPLNLKLSY